MCQLKQSIPVLNFQLRRGIRINDIEDQAIVQSYTVQSTTVQSITDQTSTVQSDTVQSDTVPSRHTDKSRSSRYRDIGNLAVAIAIYIGKMTAITAISRIQKNIFKKCILVFLAVFSCLKQAPKLLRATLSLHEHL